MAGTIYIGRVREMFQAAMERARWYWIKCPLCLDYTTLESWKDMAEYKERGYCRCGHRFNKGDVDGWFPAGKVFIWDEHEAVDG